MTLITETEALNAYCARAAEHEFVTVDTEFLRENTYFAQLCVVQIAYPGEGPDTTAIVDVLADGLDMTAVVDLMKNQSVIKVFHAARQDLEIFYHDYKVLPTPFFDTQIAAMVAGFGEQVGYETLVKSISKGKVDKSNRFTDWRRRPLSKAQIDYARGDVTYLREIYLHLHHKLTEGGRLAWVEEELAALTNPELYRVQPREQWKRVRTRTETPRFLAYIRELAELREQAALDRNVPRTRIFKDDAMLEFAAQRPKSLDDLQRLRLWPRDSRKGALAEAALAAAKRVESLLPAEYPKPAKTVPEFRAPESVVDLLKVLLKAQSERNKVASKLICTAGDLDEFAADPEAAHAVTTGWRNEIFGRTARDLLAGRVALKPNGKYIDVIPVPPKQIPEKATT